VKKYIWIIALLLVVISAPSVRATSSTPTFTCDVFCAGGLPSAPDVSFPSPTNISVTWDNFTFMFTLEAPDAPGDPYIWDGFAVPDSASTYSYFFEIVDGTTGNPDGLFASGQTIVPAAIAPFDSGTLSFSAGAGNSPEPATWLYAITAMCFVGFLLLKLKTA
jgi:hypothetical protein